jgi:hypothetical protein
VNTLEAISTSAATGDAEQQRRQLRGMVNEVVGTTFFEPMLKMAHNSVLKGKYGHGGRGEEIWQGQLDGEFARSIGRGVRTDLADALYRKLSQRA